MTSLRAPLKACLLLSWILVMVPPVVVCWLLGWRGVRQRVICVFYSGMTRILGIRVEVCGALSEERPLVLVTNHISYTDVFVLGSVAPVCFTPKSEVSGWPVIGFLCRASGCVFIDRRRQQTRRNQAALVASLQQGNCICVFPEGTTGDGQGTLPFRSSYFSLAQEVIHGRALPVQAAAVRYTRVNGREIDAASRRRIAWIGDDEFFPHLWQLLALHDIAVRVTFFPVTSEGRSGDRKALAGYCEALVKRELETGRREGK